MKIFLKKTIFTILFLFSFQLFSAETADNVTTYPNDFETSTFEDEVYDPLEPLNRVIFSFNNVLDKLILEPTAKGYRKLPSPLQSGISNFFGNLRMPLIIINQVLQGQGGNAIESTGRFVINSTIGLVGIVDVASRVGLEEKDEDFGQTLAAWGVGDGFYVVLPIFGPSNVRDAAGTFLTYTYDPINSFLIDQNQGWFIPYRITGNAIDYRSKIIDEVNALRNNSVDYYAAVRSSYYQNRKAAIRNEEDNVSAPAPIISIEFE
ncbi:MAG: putative phospholipid-binding lipoprotein MlaA [Alphaproteobacteria bacterium MarineAlpha5_Bin9]|nr:MAG: putative phospholipid-binding lipoprotein MlaA [Alphaproteobacteria bacterium MarineAlpha5_Bin9]|tara:strand:- start:3201 stop:3989 length:789 start_codon:yes stop_codon:yes gene_type:complete